MRETCGHEFESQRSISINFPVCLMFKRREISEEEAEDGGFSVYA